MMIAIRNNTIKDYCVQIDTKIAFVLVIWILHVTVSCRIMEHVCMVLFNANQ